MLFNEKSKNLVKFAIFKAFIYLVKSFKISLNLVSKILGRTIHLFY